MQVFKRQEILAITSISILIILLFQSCSPKTETEPKQVLPTISAVPEKPINITHDNMLFYVIQEKYIILAAGKYKDFGVGQAQLVSKENGAAAIKEIENPKIIKEYASFIGKAFNIYNSKKEKAKLSIKTIKILTEFIPHFGMVNRWRDDKLSDEEIANQIWDIKGSDSSKYFIVGEIEGQVESGCFATSEEKPEPVFYSEIEPDEHFAEIADKSKENKYYQEFIVEIKKLDSKTYDEYKKNFDVKAYKNPITNKILYISYIFSGSMCNGDPRFQNAYIWHYEENSLFLEEDCPHPNSFPHFVVDIDNDNKPDFFDYGNFGVIYDFYSSTIDNVPLVVLFQDCGC